LHKEFNGIEHILEMWIDFIVSQTIRKEKKKYVAKRKKVIKLRTKNYFHYIINYEYFSNLNGDVNEDENEYYDGYQDMNETNIYIFISIFIPNWKNRILLIFILK